MIIAVMIGSSMVSMLAGGGQLARVVDLDHLALRRRDAVATRRARS